MTKVNYLILRRLLVLALALPAPALLLPLAGCAGIGEAEVVSPFTGPESGPRSFETLRGEIAAQSDSLRKLYIQAQGLYPYLINQYRVRIRIEDDGEVSHIEMLDRLYVLNDFEQQFIDRLYRFRFTEYDGPPVEIIYTFSFHPKTGVTSTPAKGAKKEADFDAFAPPEKMPARGPNAVPTAERPGAAPAAPASAEEEKGVDEMRGAMDEIEEEREGAKIADEAGKQPEPEIDAPVIEEPTEEPPETRREEAAPPAATPEAAPAPKSENEETPAAESDESDPSGSTTETPVETQPEAPQQPDEPEAKTDPLDPRQWLGNPPQEQDISN